MGGGATGSAAAGARALRSHPINNFATSAPWSNLSHGFRQLCNKHLRTRRAGRAKTSWHLLPQLINIICVVDWWWCLLLPNYCIAHLPEMHAWWLAPWHTCTGARQTFRSRNRLPLRFQGHGLETREVDRAGRIDRVLPKEHQIRPFEDRAGRMVHLGAII